MASTGAENGGSPPLASLASWVRLNVGGTVFATTITTLAKDPNSFLYRICRTDDNLDSHKVCFLLFTFNVTGFARFFKKFENPQKSGKSKYITN